jgi:uncharacterized membrane protein (DUF106 family)
MKNDTMTTLLSFVLAITVIAGVVTAYLAMTRMRTLRNSQPALQVEMQRYQVAMSKAQAILNDVISYNNTAKSPELQEIIKSVQTPVQPAK